MPCHQKDVTHATCYHGEEPLHASFTLHFFPLFFYLGIKDTIFFYVWKAPSTFTLASLLFSLFSVWSSKDDLLSYQFVLMIDFLLAFNFVSHWLKLLLCFNRQTSLGRLFDRYISTPHDYLNGEKQTESYKSHLVPF